MLYPVFIIDAIIVQHVLCYLVHVDFLMILVIYHGFTHYVFLCKMLCQKWWNKTVKCILELLWILIWYWQPKLNLNSIWYWQPMLNLNNICKQSTESKSNLCWHFLCFKIHKLEMMKTIYHTYYILQIYTLDMVIQHRMWKLAYSGVLDRADDKKCSEDI